MRGHLQLDAETLVRDAVDRIAERVDRGIGDPRHVLADADVGRLVVERQDAGSREDADLALLCQGVELSLHVGIGEAAQETLGGKVEARSQVERRRLSGDLVLLLPKALQAELRAVIERHVGNEHLDKNLGPQAVELLEDALERLEIPRRAPDDESVAAGVGLHVERPLDAPAGFLLVLRQTCRRVLRSLERAEVPAAAAPEAAPAQAAAATAPEAAAAPEARGRSGIVETLHVHPAEGALVLPLAPARSTTSARSA